ncbi:MAG: hypothetical protein A2Z02_01215 [Chloroflexi bacterium RBG_16_48_7]|nr:MAG: hypothetical protein A2Z02_01215 [Chloroflexi bacterium RBG_16_48_7]
MRNNFCVYIITNRTNNVLYTGMTNNLIRRICEHKKGLVKGFSKRYQVHKLVYYESGPSVIGAIVREKQIKRMLRRQKQELISSMNREWRDLYKDLF